MEHKHRFSEKWTIFETIQIVVGIILILLGIVAFINPNENRLVFPAIFALSAFLNFVGMLRARQFYSGNRKHGLVILLHGVVAIFLTIVAIISVITL